MALINTKKNEIQLKIVYYGPGRGGKTSSLEYIQQKLASRNKAKMIKYIKLIFLILLFAVPAFGAGDGTDMVDFKGIYLYEWTVKYDKYLLVMFSFSAIFLKMHQFILVHF